MANQKPRPGSTGPVSRPARMTGPSVVPMGRKKTFLSETNKGQVVFPNQQVQWGDNPKFTDKYYKGE